MGSNRILVTGANGFIGKNLVKTLLQLNFEVVGLDLQEQSLLEHESLVYFKRDLSKESLDLKQMGVSKVVHCAAQTSVQFSMQDPLEDSNLNVTSSLKLFLACKEAEILNVVYLNSGGAIYGEMRDAPFKESDTVKPISPYAISKYSSELYGFALFANTNVSFISLALGNVYGSVLENRKGIFHEIWQAHINNRIFKIFGSDCIRDYIYVNDVVSSIILALNFRGIERFNISSSFGTENQELVNKFSALTKKPLQVEVFPKRAGDLKSSVMSNIKAKDQLGWKPLISLDEGMKTIFDI